MNTQTALGAPGGIRPSATVVEVIRDTAGVTITKVGGRLYFAIPFGHLMTRFVKDAGGTWEATTKRWWIDAAEDMRLVKDFDELVAQDLVYAEQDAERKVAQEAEMAAEQASLIWISIPFEATNVRKMAKLRFRGKYDPQSKRWGLLPDYALDVNTSLENWRAAQEAEKAAERTTVPIALYDFISQEAIAGRRYTATGRLPTEEEIAALRTDIKEGR